MSTAKKTISLLLRGREIDPNALERFVNATIHKRQFESDEMQAAAFIVALRMGAQAGDNLTAEVRRIFRMVKINKGKFDFRPSEAAIDSPAFAAVLRHVRNPSDFTIDDAVQEFTWYVAPEADTKTIKRWIEAIRPRAEKHLREEDRLMPQPPPDKNR